MARRPFIGPVVITQEYGTPNRFYRKGYHTGVDYALRHDYPLVSPTDGTVIASAYEGSTTNGRGHYVIIRGRDGVTHHLYHMSRRIVPKDLDVYEGKLIGYVGSTGASTGPHLHWETRRNDVDFAPGSWLFADRPVYVPAPPKQYVRIFGDYRTLYSSPGSGRKGVLAPNLFGGKLDYQVLESSGFYVKIKTSVFGYGWIFVGPSVAHLTQFYRR